MSECDSDGDGFRPFDLTEAEGAAFWASAGDKGDYLAPTYHLTQGDASFGTNPIANTHAFTNTVAYGQELYVRLENASTGCSGIATLSLVVKAAPEVPVPAPTYTACAEAYGTASMAFDLEGWKSRVTDDPHLLVSYHLTQADAELGAAPLPPDYSNATNPQTIFVRVSDPDAPGCHSTTMLDLRVAPKPTLEATYHAFACDPDADGHAWVDLAGLVEGIRDGADYAVSFHDNEPDALQGTHPLPGLYRTAKPFAQKAYARAVDPGTGCWAVAELEILASPAPVLPALPGLALCDTRLPIDGKTPFDLEAQGAAILAYLASSGQIHPEKGESASDYAITYHASAADAEKGVGAIANPGSYGNAANPQWVWARAYNAKTGCASTAPFLLEVRNPLPLAAPEPLSACDGGADPKDGIAEFDLTQREGEILGGATGYGVSYHRTLEDARSGTDPIATPGAFTNAGPFDPFVCVLHVAVEDLATHCRSHTTLTLRVLPLPDVPASVPPLEACDAGVAGPGTATFDLTLRDALLKGGDPKVQVAYYATLAGAEQGLEAQRIADPHAHASATATVYARLTNPGPTACGAAVAVGLVVHPTPTIGNGTDPIADFLSCGFDGLPTATFELGRKDAEILGAQDPDAFYVTYHASAADALSGKDPLPNKYANASAAQPVYFRVTGKAAGCHAQGSFKLLVGQGAAAYPPPPVATCDGADGENDGVATVDLSASAAAALGDQDPGTHWVSFHRSQADALSGKDPIADPGSYRNLAPGGEVLWAAVSNASGCVAAAALEVRVGRLPEPRLLSDGDYLCLDPATGLAVAPLPLWSGLPAEGYDFEWLLDGIPIAGASGPGHDATLPGTYEVRATDRESGCRSAPGFAAKAIGAATGPSSVSITATRPFAERQSVRVSVDGTGEYLYRIDGGPYQASPEFDGVAPGLHTVGVVDARGGCGEFSGQVRVINYPRYFTPNGDGVGDAWNVPGLADQPGAAIRVYDRNGRLVKTLRPDGPGWDGTYDGKPMPATDYWFALRYEEGGQQRELKAHFSLRR